MSDKPTPKPPLRLPPNCRDATAEAVASGVILGLVGATVARKNSGAAKAPDPDRGDDQPSMNPPQPRRDV
jgi:hypothetical protein